MRDVPLKTIRDYRQDSTQLMMSFIDVGEDGKMILSGDPTSLIPTDKLNEFSDAMELLDMKYVFKIMEEDFPEDIGIIKVKEVKDRFKADFEVERASIGALEEKFLR